MLSNTAKARLFSALALAALAAASIFVAAASASSAPVRGTTISAPKIQGARHHRGRRTRRRSIATHRQLSRAHAIPGGEGEGGLLFRGAKISDFRENQSAPGAVTEVPDPAGSGKQVLQMSVDNSDVAPITPTHDPRAQVLTPAIVEPGDETWWHASFYLPEDFPSNVPGWVSIIEGPYGPPFGGSPPVSISADDHELRFQRNETYGYDVAYRQPIVKGQWVDILLHTKFAREGFVEMWVDGQQVTFFQSEPDNFNPNHEPETQRLQMRTMDHLNDGGPNFFVLQNYREAGMFPSLTLYQGETRVGTTRASVEG